jgi:hypothetical protein
MSSIPTSLTPAQMRAVVRAIRDGRCVPFLGAGANVSCEQPKYEGLPLGAHLARLFFKELGRDQEKLQKLKGLVAELLEEMNLPLTPTDDSDGRNALEQLWEPAIAEKLFARFGLEYAREYNLARLSLEYETQVNRPELNRFLVESIPDEDCQPSPLLRTLAHLPLKLIISTNYDRLMEKALEKEKDKTKRDYKVIVQESDEGFIDRATQDIAGYPGVVLYKIHGTFSPDLPGVVVADEEESSQAEGTQKVIITEDDYIEFLTFINSKERGIPPIVSHRLKHSTLLFFGYSLEDWDFRVLYKSLIESLHREKQEKSYAFLLQREESEYIKFWVDFWSKKNIEIINQDHYQFAEQLERLYFSRSD